MTSIAPVLIVTLCRYSHFKRCIESLSACSLAEKTDLYVALDHPFKDSHLDGYKQISSYVESISGFRSVTILRRETNYGVVRNFEEATNYIFDKYDSYIVSEDDNFFSPNFLEYMNQCLQKFKERSDVFAINGYNYPVSIPEDYKNTIYLWKGMSGWGYGTWKDRWVKADISFQADRSVRSVAQFLGDRRNIRKLNSYADHYFPSLLRMVNNRRIRGDSYINMYIIKNDMRCVFPVISKVRNYGHDGSGIHCRNEVNDIYSHQMIDINRDFTIGNADVSDDASIYKILKDHFRKRTRSKIKTVLLYSRFLFNTKILKMAHLVEDK